MDTRQIMNDKEISIGERPSTPETLGHSKKPTEPNQGDLAATQDTPQKRPVRIRITTVPKARQLQR